MEDIVLQRIRQFMKKENISIRELSKRFDMSESTLGGKLNGSNKVDLKVVSLILGDFPDLSAEWLLRGEGDMYKSQNYEQPKMGFGKFLMSMLANCSKSEATKIKNLVDSVVDIQENDEG